MANPINLFSHANELFIFINDFTDKSCHLDLGNCRSSLSALVPWTLLTKIRVVDHRYVITAAELEAILRMAYNVHTLQIDSNVLFDAIFSNIDNLGIRINEQVSSIIQKKNKMSLLLGYLKILF